MNRKWLSILPAVLLLAGAAGCAAARPETAPATAEEEPQSPGIELGNALLEAIKSHDYDAFLKAYGPQEKAMAKEEFDSSYANIEKQFGQLKSFRYLTGLATPLVENRIWVVRFERTASDGKESVVQELLFRLVTGVVDGKTRVLGMGFL